MRAANASRVGDAHEHATRPARACCATAACCAAPTRSSMRPPACSPSAAITAPPRRPSPTCSACARRASTTISPPRRRRSSSCARRASTASSRAPRRSSAGEDAPLEKLARLIASHLAPNETKRDYVKVFINERRYLPDASRRRIGRKSRRIERCFERRDPGRHRRRQHPRRHRRAPGHAGHARHVQQRDQLARGRPERGRAPRSPPSSRKLVVDGLAVPRAPHRASDRERGDRSVMRQPRYHAPLRSRSCAAPPRRRCWPSARAARPDAVAFRAKQLGIYRERTWARLRRAGGARRQGPCARWA